MANFLLKDQDSITVFGEIQFVLNKNPMTCIQDERVLESGNYGETMLNNAWQNSKLRQLSATLYGYSIVDLTAYKELNIASKMGLLASTPLCFITHSKLIGLRKPLSNHLQRSHCSHCINSNIKSNAIH